MKITNEYSNKSRKTLDKRVQKIKELEFLYDMPFGWIRAVRDSLGISSRLLESRLGLQSGSISRAEQRERDKGITLDKLDQIARKMDCKLVYALIPLGEQKSLEAILETRARKLADEILRDVTNTMKLEAQGVDSKTSAAERERLVQSFVEKLDAKLWEEDR